MNHSDIQSRMANYLEGELALGDRALFDGHLDSCESCSGELSEMRATINLLRRLPTPEPPATGLNTVVGDLWRELGVTRQTPHRFVDPKGELRADGAKLLKHRVSSRQPSAPIYMNSTFTGRFTTCRRR